MEIIEHWKDVPNYEGLYRVSDLGRVKSLKWGKEKILKPGDNDRGYLRVVLFKEREGKRFFIHRLIMLAFVGESDLQVNHKNGIKTDNRLDNLEYCTRSENLQHAYDTGLRLKGEKHPASKLTRACAERIKYGHQGMTQQEIANIYGIARSLVSYIRSGKAWQHI
jgi:DNA-binding CsgD family transcriptional regulator